MIQILNRNIQHESDAMYESHSFSSCFCWLFFLLFLFLLLLFVSCVSEQKQFSEWRWSQIAKSFKLSDDPTAHSVSNPLVIEPMLLNDHLTSIINHTKERLCAERSILPSLNTSNEAVASEYISAVMTAICLYFQSDHPSIMKSPQQDLSGTYGRGPVDFVLKIGEVMVCVTEVKRYGPLVQGLAQNIAQLDAALSQSSKKRKREESSDSDSFTIGIVSDAVCWWILKMTKCTADDTTQVLMKELTPLPLNDACAPPLCAATYTHSSASSSSSSLPPSNSLDDPLNKLLLHLLPPIQECIQKYTQAAKKQKIEAADESAK